MSDFIWEIILGVSLFGFGLQIFIQPKWYAFLRQTYMDFSDHNRFWGVIWMFGGSLLIWIAIRQKMKSKEKKGK
jgi:hypothetical protein